MVSQEGFGNPDTDLIMNCKKIEEQGVKTVIITDEYAGRDGKLPSPWLTLIPKADAVVTGGNANMVIHLPKMDKVIGYPEAANIIAGGYRRQPECRRFSIDRRAPGYHRRDKRDSASTS